MAKRRPGSTATTRCWAAVRSRRVAWDRKLRRSAQMLAQFCRRRKESCKRSDRSSESMSMVRIAFAYLALFAAIVVAADAGWLPRFAEQLHDLPYGDKVLHFTMFGLLA